MGVEGRRAGRQPPVSHALDPGEGPAGQSDDHALNAPVTDQGVGADAQGRDRRGRIERRQEAGEVRFVGGQEEDVGRSTNPQPGEGGEGLVPEQAPANLRQPVPPAHGARASSWPGRA